jgi:hypothetical protein
VAAALSRAPLVRHAQYGGGDRQRRDGPLPHPCVSGPWRRGTAGCRSGWRGSMSMPRRSKLRSLNLITSRATTLPADGISRASRSRRRRADQRHHRPNRRSCPDVCVGLSAWRKPLSGVGVCRVGLGDGRGAEAQAPVGQRHPVLCTRAGLMMRVINRESGEKRYGPDRRVGSNRNGRRIWNWRSVCDDTGARGRQGGGDRYGR